jgi:hypothetical protein
VFHLELIASGVPTHLSWEEGLTAVGQARGRFYQVAKRDIGLDISSSPEHYARQLGRLTPAEK